MECPNCKQINPTDAVACKACGRPLLSASSISTEPALVPRLGEHIFVGRRWEMEGLQATLEDTLAGRGRVVLLEGEPGIGKTRLASEFAAFAERRGARVLVGRCYEGEGAPPFWPW